MYVLHSCTQKYTKNLVIHNMTKHDQTVGFIKKTIKFPFKDYVRIPPKKFTQRHKNSERKLRKKGDSLVKKMQFDIQI